MGWSIAGDTRILLATLLALLGTRTAAEEPAIAVLINATAFTYEVRAESASLDPSRLDTPLTLTQLFATGNQRIVELDFRTGACATLVLAPGSQIRFPLLDPGPGAIRVWLELLPEGGGKHSSLGYLYYHSYCSLLLRRPTLQLSGALYEQGHSIPFRMTQVDDRILFLETAEDQPIAPGSTCAIL